MLLLTLLATWLLIHKQQDVVKVLGLCAIAGLGWQLAF